MKLKNKWLEKGLCLLCGGKKKRAKCDCWTCGKCGRVYTCAKCMNLNFHKFKKGPFKKFSRK